MVRERKQRHSRSLSRQMFLSILAVTGTVLAVLFAVSLSMLQKSYNREEETTIRDNLIKCGRITDISLEYIEQSAQMLSTNATVISSVVAPNHARVDRSLTLMNLLRDVARSSELISQAVLYIDYDRSVYSSDMSEVHSSMDTDLYSVVSAYQEDYTVSGEKAVLYGIDDSTYMLQDIPINGKKRLGTIILEVNRKNLYQQIEDSGDNSYIVVATPEGELFLAAENLPADILEMIYRTDDQARRKGNLTVYRSDQSGLIFYNWKDNISSLASLVARFTPLYFIAALLAVFGIFYSAYASRAAYRPIRNLIRTVAEDTGVSHEQDTGNEIDYLRNLFQSTARDRESLIATTAVLIPEIERRLIADLAVEHAGWEHTEESLRKINSRFSQNGIFAVMAFAFEEEDGTQPDLPAQKQFIREMEPQLEEAAGAAYSLCLIPMDGSPCMGLIRADAGTDSEKLRELTKKMAVIIRKAAEQRGKKLHAGIGRLCAAVRETVVAYREACDALAQGTWQGEAAQVDEAKIQEHLDRCIDLILEKRSAQDETDGFCSMISAMRLSSEALQKLVIIYVDVLERQYRLYGTGQALIREHTGLQDAEALMELLLREDTDYVLWITEYCTRKGNRQVLSAKRYIVRHYQDGMLSLGEVADAVGVKDTYLSTLFKSVTGMRFSDFLKDYRIRRAKEYLKKKDIPIKEICSACGFNSVQSFNRVFKQETGLAPGEYRAACLRHSAS